MAKKKFLNAASALTLTVAMVAPATLAVTLSSVEMVQAAVVRSIDVKGNKRVDAQTIRENTGIKVGKDFSSTSIDEALKRLFAMGLFSDVKMKQVGSSLVINVKEYEVVNQVLFQGNKKVKDPDITRNISLKPREAFDPAKLTADEQTIRDLYRSLGRNDVTVSAQTVNVGEGRVNIVFKINEGKKTKIENVTFEGSKAFGQRRLRDVIATKQSNFLSWLTKGDVYNEDRLAADEEALRRFYYNHGYADFRVLSAKADFDEATNSYNINFVVEEGARYTLGDVQVDSSVENVDAAALQKVVKTHHGDVYNAKRIEDSVLAISDKIADSGYAFAKVEPRGDRDFNNHTISIVYNVDQGPRAYVERIEIRGNDKTRDYVIRREIEMSEGDAYNQTIVQRAKRRLEGLGFFQTVNVSTAPGDQPDQVVLIVDVTEKSTGEFSIGGGYTTGGDSPGASVEASITERNFLGRGQYIRIGAGAGQDDARDYNFSFTEPYFLGYRLAVGFDVYHRTYRMNDDYDVKQNGGTLRMGVPITENLTGSVAYNYVREEYDIDNSSSTKDAQYESYAGAIVNASEGAWTRSSISYGLTYNTIDDMKAPHEGLFIRGVQEYAGLGGDASFLKTTGKAMMYKTISETYDIVGLLSGGGGYIHEIDNNGVRVFDMFKSSSDIIRGFKYNGIGPMQRAGNDDAYFLGGNTYINGTAEVQFPMPIVPDSLGMRGAIFADAATIYGNSYTVTDSREKAVTGKDSAWRASAGVSLMWASPFGPLRFDYAFPVKKEEGDRTQSFNFGVSTKF